MIFYLDETRSAKSQLESISGESHAAMTEMQSQMLDLSCHHHLSEPYFGPS